MTLQKSWRDVLVEQHNAVSNAFNWGDEKRKSIYLNEQQIHLNEV